ncbi:MAG: pyocin knob domain-containing protein, partial [Oscillospiraceae bacterium]|nr:pyocin knob domain-containing protein [Oscillospiraceae bacterium]
REKVCTRLDGNGNIQTCYLMHITVDTIAEIPDAKENWLAGSRCDMLEDGGHVYMLSNGREWVEVNFFNRVGEGGSTDLSDYYTKPQTDERITEKVAEIVADAPEDFNTLKELSDWISSHEDSAAAMNTAINQKVDKVPGMGLSQNSFTTAEKTKLAGLASYDDSVIRSDVNDLQTQINAIETILDTSFVENESISGGKGGDLDTATKTGLYRFHGNPLNSPTDVTDSYGILLVFKTHGSVYYSAQIAIVSPRSASFGISTNSGVFIRTTTSSSDGEWSAWKKFSLTDIT